MANGRNNFHWSDETLRRINTAVHNEAARIRVGRRVLPLFGKSTGFMGSIPSHRLNPRVAGQPLSLRPNQHLTPVEISVDFSLAPEDCNDEQAVMALAIPAVYELALAEDRIALLGADTAPLPGNVRERNLNEQRGLFREALEAAAALAGNPPPAAGAPLPQVPANRTILQSILRGITALRTRNHHGEYCAIVSPDLYQAAFEPRPNRREGLIYEIRPLLRNAKEGIHEGFQYSPAAQGRTGVIFSLGGNTLDIAVPVDTMVELVNEERGALLRVVEQFRLRVNDPTAVVALT